MAINYTQYDANGNLQQRNSDTFSYDAHNRLDIANGAFGSRNYDYNKTGNRSKLVSSTTTNYTYAANSNRLSTINGAAVTIDANGNVTNQGTRLYNYTPANHLLTAYNSTTLLASTRPPGELMFDTFGCVPPAGHAVRYCNGPCGAAVIVTEYAVATAGIPQADDGNRKRRVSPAFRVGGPNGPGVR